LQVRFLARSFGVPGDHYGQASHGYRFPFGPVAIIAPFNFPLEIPILQIMGALYMGNKVVFKGDSRVSVVMEQVCGLFTYHERQDPSSTVAVRMDKSTYSAEPCLKRQDFRPTSDRILMLQFLGTT
jgi:hypothetical protein